MHNDNEFEKRYDCDPADCNDGYRCKNGSDSESAQEFINAPEEYVPSYGDGNKSDSDIDYNIGEKEMTEYQMRQEIENSKTVLTDIYAPFDEMAATRDNDDLYSTDTSSCAEQRCALDDYEIISDVLGSEKQLVKLYSTALCESAEEGLRNVIRDNLMECAADQYKTFEFMEKRGMYPTEQAEEEKIVQAKQQFQPLCKCHNCD